MSDGLGGRVVVGYEGGATGLDALTFANRWATTSHERVSVVTVHPGAAPLGAGRVDAEWVAYERAEADRLLQEAAEHVSDGVSAEYVRVDSGSAAHGLSDAVEPDGRDDGTLLVLGSRRNRGMRRTYPGSTAERVLHGVGVPTVIVPWGYADSVDRPLSRVSVAFVDTPEGRVAFEQAVGIARRLSADLEVVSVVPDTRIVPGLGEQRLFGTEQRRGYQHSLDAVMALAPDDVTVTGRLLDGPVIDALAELSLDDVDVLVTGSRGYGPVRRVLMGGVSSRVVRHSKVPVVVAPRGG